MKRYVIDLETWSDLDLKKYGVKNYAKSPNTVIRVAAWQEVGDDQIYSISFLNPNKEALKRWQTMHEEVQAGEAMFIAHNAGFERDIFNYNNHKHITAPNPCILYTAKHFRCTMQMSNICRGPSSLEMAAQFFNLPVKKDTKAKALMKETCKYTEKEKSIKRRGHELIPTDIGVGTIYFNQEVEDLVEEYCKQDVNVTAQLYAILCGKITELHSTDFIQDILSKGLAVHNRMADTGIPVDLNRAAQIVNVQKEMEKKQAELVQPLGCGFGQRIPILKYWNDKGFDINSVAKDKIQAAIAANEGHTEGVAFFREYTQLNKTSLKKAQQVLEKANEGRLFDTLVFSGAITTGRWSGRGFQPQNLPRPSCKYEELPALLAKKDFDGAQSALRTIITPSKGMFFSPDLSQVEARHSLYISGEIEAHDKMAAGEDLYRETAESIFRQKEINSEQRAVGKEAILSGQYGVGAKTYKKYLFDKTGISMSLEEAKKVIQSYRRKYAKIVKKWYEYDHQMKLAQALKKPLKIKLRTGRYLDYGIVKNRIVKDKETGEEREVTYYKGVSSQTGKIQWKTLWGGKIFQHVVQAECRDILLVKMIDMESKGHEAVFCVHDEVIYDCSLTDKQQIAADWETAGIDKIHSLFPNLGIGSDVNFKERYYK